MLIDVDVDELQHALGGVVLEAAYLERVLRAAVSARTLTEVRQLADQVADAASGLKVAMTAALGSDWVLVEDQLRQELGHDISADPGSGGP